MRVRNYAGSLSTQDKSQCFMLSRVLLYMHRLLARYSTPDHEILETIHWLLGSSIVEEDLLPLVSMFSGALISRRFESDIEEEIHNPHDFAYVMDQVLRKSRRSEQLAIVDLLRDLLNKRMNHLQYSGSSDIEKNLDTLQEMFDLSELEKEICLFLFALSIFDEVQSLFQYHLQCDRFAGRNYLVLCPLNSYFIALASI